MFEPNNLFPFTKSIVESTAPAFPAVYCLSDANNVILYVAIADNVKTQLLMHLTGEMGTRAKKFGVTLCTDPPTVLAKALAELQSSGKSPEFNQSSG